MKIIHKEGWTEDELKGFTGVIHTNVYGSVKTMLAAMEDLGIAFAKSSNKVF